MKNCKQTFPSNVWKCGYLKVGRSLLKALFQGNMEQRQLARILLCVQTFAYFSEGQVCTNEGAYICRPGEWITTYTEMGQWAEVERHQVKTRLKKLEQLGLLTVEHLGSYKRIRLTHYEPAIQTPLQENLVNDNLFVHAGHFYASTNEQKGGEA